MNSSQNVNDSAFQNLMVQIRLYIDSKQFDSLQYLLEDETEQKIQRIRENLTKKEKEIFQQVLSNIKRASSAKNKSDQIQNEQKVKAILTQEKSDDEEQVIETLQKQYQVSNIFYGENYSYPFLGLIQKMSTLYFSRLHPNPFPQSSLKMLHSLIQTLSTYVFNSKIKDNYINTKKKRKLNFNNYLKEYLFFVFQKQYQKFTSFHKMFKSLKSQISKNHQADSHSLRDKSDQNSPLTQTKNLEELNYFTKISDQIKNEHEFREFSKIKSLNFLYFGQKRLRQLIDSSNNFFVEQIQKEIFQLISFIICKFVRKVILQCIKQKKNGFLQFLNHKQSIQAINVKIIGNFIIDQYNKKIQDFLKLDEPIQQIAKRTFIREFYEYDYQKFIPKNQIYQAQKALQSKKSSATNLPEEVWLNSKHYQSLWIQRISAEQNARQDNQQRIFKRQKGKNNDYFKFIKLHPKQFEDNNAILWLQYLTTIHKVSSTQSIQNEQILPQNQKGNQKIGCKTRKKIKLQSLSN